VLGVEAVDETPESHGPAGAGSPVSSMMPRAALAISRRASSDGYAEGYVWGFFTLY
jgi:hypothetical protein